MAWNKGHCTGWWDTYLGIYIGDCCKGHDSNCNTHTFFKCLYKKVGLHSIYISIGGMLGCLIKYFKL